MYCKLLKLSNGEDIIMSTEDNYETFKDKEFLIGKHAVQVGVVRIPRGTGVMETYILQPWIRMAATDLVSIPVTSVVAIVDIDEKAAQQYLSFVEDKPGLTLEVSEEEDLEELNFEEEEYDGYPPSRNGHTIH
jgi:hypothetical protein